MSDKELPPENSSPQPHGEQPADLPTSPSGFSVKRSRKDDIIFGENLLEAASDNKDSAPQKDSDSVPPPDNSTGDDKD